MILSDFMNVLTKPLMVVGLSLSLFACGGDKPAESTAPTADKQATPTSNDKALVVAVSPYFAPYVYLDNSGNVSGFDVDLLNSIAQKKGLTIQYKPTSDFGQIFTEVDNKTADIALSAILQTEERASKYGLTQPYGSDSLVYFYRADNGKIANLTLSSLSDLSGKNLILSGTAGTQQMQYIQSVSAETNIVPTSTDFLAFTNVLQQKADVGFTDKGIFQHFVKNNLKDNSIQLKSVSYQNEPSNHVMVVHKDNVELLNTLNEGINELVQSGEIKQLEQKHGLE